MNTTINLPGFEEFTVQHTEEIDGVYRLFVEKEIEPHRCPHCATYTTSVHVIGRRRSSTLVYSEGGHMFFIEKEDMYVGEVAANVSMRIIPL